LRKGAALTLDMAPDVATSFKTPASQALEPDSPPPAPAT
jgi:hypothetical protein